MTHRCFEQAKPLGFVQGVFGIVSDLFIWFLPLPVVWNLQMPTRKKIGVTTIFATGLLAVIASNLVLYYRIQQSNKKDQFWMLSAALLLSMVETSVGVICGCTPYLAKFWRHERSSNSLVGLVKRIALRLATLSSRSKFATNGRFTTLERAESKLADRGDYVETKVLGSIQG
ncbi:MAG: hypothetical protein Q9181_006051, partial [Wetmoreana brouardii]